MRITWLSTNLLRAHALSTGFRCCSHGSHQLTSAQVTSALRPFYFNVHPDRFGNHPREKQINENSLKLLNEYFENVLNHRQKTGLLQVTFYLKENINQQSSSSFVSSPTSSKTSPNLSSLKLQLSYTANPIDTVHKILIKCKLPTKTIDELSKKVLYKSRNDGIELNSNINNAFHGPFPTAGDMFWRNDTATRDDIRFAREQIRRAPNDTLVEWLQANIQTSRANVETSKAIEEGIDRLSTELKNSLGLTDLTYDCDWERSHFRGMLISFRTLVSQHPTEMAVLNQRTLVFGRNSGVNLNGEIVLNIEDVRNGWIRRLRTIPNFDPLLKQFPKIEARLSSLLFNIKIVRPNGLMVDLYVKKLQQLIQSLEDSKHKISAHNMIFGDLSRYSLSISGSMSEPEAQISPSGCFIVPTNPSACDILDFIKSHLDEADLAMGRYDRNQKAHELLVKRLQEEMDVQISRNGVSLERMIECCERILEFQTKLGDLRGTKVKVSNFYGLCNDGALCIPYNWTL